MTKIKEAAYYSNDRLRTPHLHNASYLFPIINFTENLVRKEKKKYFQYQRTTISIKSALISKLKLIRMSEFNILILPLNKRGLTLKMF